MVIGLKRFYTVHRLQCKCLCVRSFLSDRFYSLKLQLVAEFLVYTVKGVRCFLTFAMLSFYCAKSCAVLHVRITDTVNLHNRHSMGLRIDVRLQKLSDYPVFPWYSRGRSSI